MRNRAVLTRRKPEILTVSRSKALTSCGGQVFQYVGGSGEGAQLPGEPQ